MKRVLVCGAGGFIGGHLARRLKLEGHEVTGVDLKRHEFAPTAADRFVIGDLTQQAFVQNLFKTEFDEVYQLAADMGGAGFIFSGENDAQILSNSSLINLNVLRFGTGKMGKIFYSSSACIYPEHNQMDPDNPNCEESSAYPAAPDSEYGWEKLFSERLYLAFKRNARLDVRIARFHNIFGPEGTWAGGREKAPAAVCRKVASTADGGSIEIWGDGKQTRTFLYIDECVEGVLRLMNSPFVGPVNIGSAELISINDLAYMAMAIAGKKQSIEHVTGPNGVRGRSSDNRMIEKELNWAPSRPLREGMTKTFAWVASQVEKTGWTEPTRGGKPIKRAS